MKILHQEKIKRFVVNQSQRGYSFYRIGRANENGVTDLKPIPIEILRILFYGFAKVNNNANR